MTERQSKLIKLVNIYHKIEVSRLAELLDVSQVTIRKDLDHLEEEGLLAREHGYALIKNANDINTRLTINYDTKLKIATKAAEMVSNGETVMLESGSTCALLAEQLAKLKKDITIVTKRRLYLRRPYAGGNHEIYGEFRQPYHHSCRFKQVFPEGRCHSVHLFRYRHSLHRLWHLPGDHRYPDTE